VIVCKFGGTSVQDAEAIGRLVGIVRARREEQPVLVVSALARVTDALLHLARLTAAGDPVTMEAAVVELLERHRSVARGIRGGERAVEPIHADAAALVDQLTARLSHVLSARELDALMGHGELWSSRLVVAALEGAGLPAEWVDARCLVVTDERHGRATPRMEPIAERAGAVIRPLLALGRIPVTQGFIGATVEGVPTTLGRGGSDFTAALLGAALDAARVEIWTDVDGLMTADPRVVPTARTLAGASYDEAAELANFCARVLHPATQLPLVEKRIPMAVLNSRRPELPGTTIVSQVAPEADARSPVRSISWKRGVTLINIRAPRMLGSFGFLRALFEVFERHEAVVDVLASSEVSISLTLEDRGRLEDILRDLAPLGETTVDDHRAIVAVVGTGMRETPGMAARIFGAVMPANVEIISQGASEINVTFVVREEDGPDVVRRLHREFFGE
jgi:aspartate kinase